MGWQAGVGPAKWPWVGACGVQGEAWRGGSVHPGIEKAPGKPGGCSHVMAEGKEEHSNSLQRLPVEKQKTTMSTSSAEFYGLSVSQWFLTDFLLYFWLYRTPIHFLSDYIFRQLDWFETAEWQVYEHTGIFATTVDLVPFLCLIIRFYCLSRLNVSNSIFLSMTR